MSSLHTSSVMYMYMYMHVDMYMYMCIVIRNILLVSFTCYTQLYVVHLSPWYFDINPDFPPAQVQPGSYEGAVLRPMKSSEDPQDYEGLIKPANNGTTNGTQNRYSCHVMIT